MIFLDTNVLSELNTQMQSTGTSRPRPSIKAGTLTSQMAR